MRVIPTELSELIPTTFAMMPRWRSSGVATVAAIVAGLAPGIFPLTVMVGYSTCGRGATGNFRKAKNPASTTAIVNSVVATGRAMNGADGFTLRGLARHPHRRRC